ncbi:MAG TPA: MFS transporter [bacterium]|nr:MFS transporter [bacterium]
MWKKTFVSAFIAQVLSIFGFSFAMPFLPFFISELGTYSKGQQAFWSGIALGSTAVTLGIFAPLWGILADRYGRKMMVCRAMFGGTVVLLLMSMVRTVGQLVACRLLQGVFTGTIAASVALVASVTPPHRCGLTLGMMQAAVFIGMCLGPLFGGVVADILGYRAAFLIGALIVLAGGLLVLLGVHEEFVPPDKEKDGPAMGFREILMIGGFMMAVLVMFGVRASESMINPSFPLIIKEIVPNSKNLNSITGFVVAMAALSGALSAALLGHMGDRWGQKRILVGCCVFASVASLGHFFAYTIPFLFAARILFGLSVAGMLPAANAMIYSVIDKRCIGKAYGVATSLSMIGAALGPFTGGTIARFTALRTPFLFVAAAQIILAYLIGVYVKTSVKPSSKLY